MRILALDYGERHIGLAVSDLLRLTAQPLETYHLKALMEENRKFFQELVARLDIGEIVIGFPLRMDGSQGTRTQKTREFAGWLEKAVRRPIVFWDERLTTQQALYILKNRKIKGKKTKDYEDQVSAVIILSAYLEKKRQDSDDPQSP